MRTSRVVIALTVAGGLLLTAVPSGSAADTEAGQRPVDTTLVPFPGEAFIEGVVLDERGHPVDDINVEAFPAGREASDPVASWLTYESPDAEHPHGFYLLDVVPGSYVIRLSSLEGAHEPFRSQWYADKRVVTVGDQEALRLKPVTLERGRAESQCQLALVDDVVPAAHRPQVRVRIKSPDATRVIGSIRVTMNGQKVRTDRLGRQDRGLVVLRLPKRRPGTYRVVVSYSGSGEVKRSHSQVHVLRVAKPGRAPHSTRPNAW